jgi:hypothetical protein
MTSVDARNLALEFIRRLERNHPSVRPQTSQR